MADYFVLLLFTEEMFSNIRRILDLLVGVPYNIMVRKKGRFLRLFLHKFKEQAGGRERK